MKKFTVALMALVAFPALAEPSALSVDEMTNQYLVETGQLRVELGKARAEIASLRKQIEDARKTVQKADEKK
ncbi:hypothetical protein [Methylocystis sp. S23]